MSTTKNPYVARALDSIFQMRYSAAKNELVSVSGDDSFVNAMNTLITCLEVLVGTSQKIEECNFEQLPQQIIQIRATLTEIQQRISDAATSPLIEGSKLFVNLSIRSFTISKFLHYELSQRALTHIQNDTPTDTQTITSVLKQLRATKEQLPLAISNSEILEIEKASGLS